MQNKFVMKAIVASLAVAGMSAGISPVFAQAKISDNVVKIGILTDLSGVYSDLAGNGSVIAAKLAVEEMGGKVLGMPVEVISADHQNKPDESPSSCPKISDFMTNSAYLHNAETTVGKITTR
jgi:ABC-type branched-subunit amino acid transport system substrate-binding protein